MKKPDSLRAKLTEGLPDLARDPNRLRIWIEEGHVRCHAQDPELGGNLSFTLEYKLTVVIEGWAQSQLLIWILLIDWLRVQQPDLLTPANSRTAIPFEADLLSEKEADISFDLKLTEPVKVTRRPDGGFDMQVIAESDPLMPDAVSMIPGGAPLTSLWLDGVQLLPDPLDAPA